MGGLSLSSFIEDTQYLLSVDFVQSSLIASALLGILSGVMTSLIVLRQMSFSVHATSELALMGASAALLFGLNLGFGAVAGAIVAAIILAVLGFKGQQDSAIGVVMSFGLGLSVLFLHLYPGNSNRALALLTGQIVGISGQNLWLLAGTTLLVVVTVAALWRPLLFASADPVMAQAAGVLAVESLGLAGSGKLVYFMTIDEAKFRKPVVPGDTIYLHITKIQQRGAVWKFKGEAKVNGVLCAEATFAAMILDE